MIRSVSGGEGCVQLIKHLGQLPAKKPSSPFQSRLETIFQTLSGIFHARATGTAPSALNSLKLKA